MIYESKLYHHGILGQRKGVKNGPPYPLSAQAHSSSEKKAGWRKTLDKKTAAKHIPKTIGGIASGAAYVETKKVMEPLARKAIRRFLPDMTTNERQVTAAALSSIAALSSSIIVNAACTKIGNKIADKYLEENKE